MSTNRFNRREFLKLSLLFPFTRITNPRLHPSQSLKWAAKDGNDLPNIIILVFDALSAQHVSTLGYHRETTPNLSRFADRATVYHRHYSAGNFTLPGTASLLTGTYPWSHRGLHLFGSVLNDYAEKNIFNLLAADYHTIAYTHNYIAQLLLNQFRDHIDHFAPAYELSLFSEIFSDRLFPRDFNSAFWGESVFRESLFFPLFQRIWQLFYLRELTQEYSEDFPRGIPTNSIGFYFTLEDSIDWITLLVMGAPKPLLGYFHLFPPHEPYTTRGEFVDRFADDWIPAAKPPHPFSEGYSDAYLADQWQQYDEYIAYADAAFGTLYNRLDKGGFLDNTYLVVTSDHGQLFERGIHAHNTPVLYDPVIRVPLLILSPGQEEGQEVHTITSSTDLLPTLLQAANKNIPDWVEGQILPTFGDSKMESERPVFAVEAKSNPKRGPLRKATLSLIQENYKLIRYLGYQGCPDGYELYDLERDPEERHDVYSIQRATAADLQKKLERKLEEVEGRG
jgi:arylsulfatase A-like enzyme